MSRRDCNGRAGVLMAAALWFIVGRRTWVVVLGHIIKGMYPWLWPEFELPPITVAGNTLLRISVTGTETLVFYFLAVVLAIAKLRKP
ncbi:hypothetical protein PWR05_35815 [Paraburkholderia sp. A2RI-6]|uniref:hypothetical protein n=1 Tax=Paraburkholderia sp. A2RI-6 TaxID=3028371 RepID=UPI003B7DBF88